MALAIAEGGLIVRATVDRNRRLLALRSAGWSTRRLAHKFGISRIRVRQILEARGDPLHDEMRALEAMTVGELERERDIRRDRIRSDRRRLRLIEEELDSRLVDRLNGIAG